MIDWIVQLTLDPAFRRKFEIIIFIAVIYFVIGIFKKEQCS
jgi:uncharacterized membrane protein